MKRTSWILCAVVALAASAAQAQFDLQITEIWPGNEPGDNLTEDWFEVTNVGNATFTEGVDGDLYFDDDSQGLDNGIFDAGIPDLISGYGSIAPGESVVFADESLSEFFTVWGNVVLPSLGLYEGSGLSQGGDGVTLFVDDELTGVDQFDIVDFEVYPDANAFGGQSYDVTLGAFSTVGNASGALASAVANDVGQFAVASIGPAIPEPTTVALAALAACGLVARRR